MEDKKLDYKQLLFNVLSYFNLDSATKDFYYIYREDTSHTIEELLDLDTDTAASVLEEYRSRSLK